ncbi:nuclease A inhibitor-like protein [Chitinophaga dinghuensis]|uniref:Nuclease A inhibitor-like protein n=1 Tax=Chitinophaga dinghuensis TaxID=1539050 RepID=A0A327VVP9_9BACT|nr:nuclease A inhibitor family protein [Chitinophaga dinghuensis]RAJ80077.1 nuclease A inhibitor-like protein [Chitinophaga dinghuensis]
MQPNSLLENLMSKVTGILYYSESEYPFTIEQWEPLTEEEVAATLATRHQVDSNIVKSVNPTVFFNEVEHAPDPNDEPIVENAQKFETLHQFLNEHFSNIQVFRVENSASIPIYIVCHQPDGTCVALITTAIES